MQRAGAAASTTGNLELQSSKFDSQQGYNPTLTLNKAI